jgi:hypothetical protein
MSDNYFEFKNFFLTDTAYESQIMTLDSSQAPSHISTPNITDDSTEYQVSDESEPELFKSMQDNNIYARQDNNIYARQDNNIYARQDIDIYARQDIDPIENVDTTYQLVGIATRRGYEDVEPGWWVVDINDPDELSKIKKRSLCVSSLVGISGLFKYDNLKESLVNKKVIIEITYNGRGYCQWKKNRIIQLI